jgi:hypothetical protein
MTLLWGTVRSEALKKASQYTGVKLTDAVSVTQAGQAKDRAGKIGGHYK